MEKNTYIHIYRKGTSTNDPLHLLVPFTDTKPSNVGGTNITVYVRMVMSFMYWS